MRTFLNLGFMVLIGCFTASAHAGLITITNSTVWSDADDSGIGSHVNNTSLAIPTNTTLAASVDGSSSITGISYNEVGGETVIDFDLTHVRAGSYLSYAYSYQQGMTFTANANATFTLSGFYNMTGENTVYLLTDLYDNTANATLFYNYQHSDATLNEAFLLGQAGGDYGNGLIGGLTGNLTAGHTYQFSFHTFIQAIASGVKGATDDGASAVGNITLTIGESTTAVPEPASFALLGLTSLGGLGVRWRQRRNAKHAEAAA